jgi:hypothetical protein
MCHALQTLITPTTALARLHRLFRVAASLFALLLVYFLIVYFVEVLAALSVRAEPFNCEVDAGPGFVVVGDVRF